MNEELRKSSSLYVSEKSGRKERKTYNKIAKAKTQTIKSEQSTLVSTLKETSGHYFETSYNSMTNAHPLPKFPKKTCYNYKCKNLKNFTFNSEKQKLEIKRKTDTFGKSFFEAQINIEKK